MRPHVINKGLTNCGTITFLHPVPCSFIRRMLESIVAISPDLKIHNSQASFLILATTLHMRMQCATKAGLQQQHHDSIFFYVEPY